MKALAVVGTVCAAVLFVTTNTPYSQSLFSRSSRDPALQRELESEFVRFIATYGKSYASKTEVPTRFEQFARNYLMIKEHNAKGKEVSFTMAVNHMADMHEHEIATARGGINIDEATLLEFQMNKLNQNDTPGNFTPTYYPPIDWRDYNRVSPVLDQGQCGSCWAFSAADTLQSAMAIKLNLTISDGNPNYTASIQHLVDCDYNNLGCNGGLQYRAYSYIKEKGFFSNSDYYYKNYLEKKLDCKDRAVWRKRRLEPSLIPSGWVNESAYSVKAFL